MNELKHIGLIPDGNRRWALNKKLDYYTAYHISGEILSNSIKSFIRYAGDELNNITIYLMSKRNLQRGREDLQAVIDAFSFWGSERLPTILSEEKIQPKIVRTRHMPKQDNVPAQISSSFEKFYQTIKSLEDLKIENPKYNLFLLAGYDPWEEITTAYQTKNKKDSPFSIDDLFVNKRIDLVIRTSGEHRISDFVPLQSGYAEFCFVDKYFQDLADTDIKKAISQYNGRNRTFGQ